MKKRILIAGGAGYVGSILSTTLSKNGHDVCVFDPLWFGNYLPDTIKVIQIKSSELKIEDILNFDVVIFLGGLANDLMADYDNYKNYEENLAAPMHLAYITKKASEISIAKRFIYAGSCSVYGYTSHEFKTEKSTIDVQYPYGIAKYMADYGIIRLTSPTFRPIVIRKGTVGGWSPRMRFDLVINTMTKSALTTNEIHVFHPNVWRAIVDIQDLASAYSIVVEQSLDIVGVFNIANENCKIIDIATQVKQTIEKETNQKINIINHNGTDARSYRVDLSKSAKILNFNPTRTINDTVKSILFNKNNIVNFNDKKYYNIEVFKGLS